MLVCANCGVNVSVTISDLDFKDKHSMGLFEIQT